MSGLAGLLAGRHPAGIYRWQSELSAAEVRAPVEVAGWRFGYVDGWTAPGRAGLLTGVAATLAFPDWFGQNFDALADCLRDLPGPTLLLWDGWGALASEEPEIFEIARAVFEERSGEQPAFAVLLRGAGPAVGVPLLG